MGVNIFVGGPAGMMARGGDGVLVGVRPSSGGGGELATIRKEF